MRAHWAWLTGGGARREMQARRPPGSRALRRLAGQWRRQREGWWACSAGPVGPGRDRAGCEAAGRRALALLTSAGRGRPGGAARHTRKCIWLGPPHPVRQGALVGAIHPSRRHALVLGRRLRGLLQSW